MSSTLTIISWLPWVWKSTLWDRLQRMDPDIVHCDIDNVLEAVLDNPKALRQIWSEFMPKNHKLIFTIWNQRDIVRLILSDSILLSLFHGAIFARSIPILRRMQEVKHATYGIISLQWWNICDRAILLQQAQLEWYKSVDIIEVQGKTKDVINVAREREGEDTIAEFWWSTRPVVIRKADRRQILWDIKSYEAYNRKKEKWFRRYSKLNRTQMQDDAEIMKVAQWIKW